MFFISLRQILRRRWSESRNRYGRASLGDIGSLPPIHRGTTRRLLRPAFHDAVRLVEPRTNSSTRARRMNVSARCALATNDSHPSTAPAAAAHVLNADRVRPDVIVPMPMLVHGKAIGHNRKQRPIAVSPPA